MYYITCNMRNIANPDNFVGENENGKSLRYFLHSEVCILKFSHVDLHCAPNIIQHFMDMYFSVC